LDPVKTAKGGIALFAHIALQHRGIGLAQVDKDEAVDDIREFSIEIEGDQFCSNLRVLLDEDREAFAIIFDIRDGFGQFVEIA
jgi:hypothetical protein